MNPDGSLEASRTLRVVLVLAFMLAACAAEIDMPGPDEGELASQLDVKRSSVVGGSEVSTCDWPSTVRVLGASQCTGTLIHPRVVTTAAHCLNGTTARIAFGGPRDSTGFTVSARCRAGARGSAGLRNGNDWAYCVLPEDPRVAALAVTPPLVGCEAERFLKPGARAWVVGYGTTGPRGQGGGVKREVEVAINAIDRTRGTIDVGDATVGACHGDSGGPLYLRILGATGTDYGYRLIGSTSGPGARSCDCTCSTSYVSIATHVAELERTEGIDVTPCTDANGAWAPGPDCRALPSARARASGSFPSCTVPRTSEAIETCGPNGSSDEADASVPPRSGAQHDAGDPRNPSDVAEAGVPDAGESGEPRIGRDAAVVAERDAAQAERGDTDPTSDHGRKDAGGRSSNARGRKDAAADDDGESDEAYERDTEAARVESGGCSIGHTNLRSEALAWGVLLSGLMCRRSRRGRRRATNPHD